MLKGNCMGDSQELSDFTYLEISPVRNEADDSADYTAMERCLPTEATIWTIYGRDQEGQALALHDADIPGLAKMLAAMVKETGMKVVYSDSAYFSSKEPETLTGLCDSLGTLVWDHIDDDKGPLPDDPEDYADFADDHPLDELRSAIGDECDYFGAQTSGKAA